MENGGIELETGKELIVSMDEVVGTTDKISVTYEGLVDDVEKGSTILLDDGLIGLEVLNVDAAKREIKTKVLNNGTLKNKKVLTYRASASIFRVSLKKMHETSFSVLSRSRLHRAIFHTPFHGRA